MVAANAAPRRRWALILVLGAWIAPDVAAAQAGRGGEARGVLTSVITDRATVEGEGDAEESGEPAETEAPPASESRSVGVPDRGRLRDAAELSESEHLFVRESRREATFGTAELVGLIERGANAVGALHGGPKLVVGDLSRRSGRRLHPHRSHQSGRDVDIGFYLDGAEGEPAQPPRFVRIGRRTGCGRIGQDRYCFDPVRNWDLLVALVQDPVARIQYVLVAPDIRRRVLAEGERRGAPQALLERVRTVTEPHSGSRAHRSHFHVRIYCPLDDRPGCVDEPPYHDWYEGEPAPPSAGVRRMRSRQRTIARRRAEIRRQRAQARARRRARRRRAARRRAVRRRAARRRARRRARD